MLLCSLLERPAVENVLQHLIEREWVRKLPRQPGSRESRFAHLFSGEADFAIDETPASANAVSRAAPGAFDRIAALEAQLAQLRREFDEFRRGFE